MRPFRHTVAVFLVVLAAVALAGCNADDSGNAGLTTSTPTATRTTGSTKTDTSGAHTVVTDTTSTQATVTRGSDDD